MASLSPGGCVAFDLYIHLTSVSVKSFDQSRHLFQGEGGGGLLLIPGKWVNLFHNCEKSFGIGFYVIPPFMSNTWSLILFQKYRLVFPT